VGRPDEGPSVTPHERVYDPYGLLLNPDELRFRDELTQFLAGHEGIIARQFFRGRGGPARALYQELGSRGWLSMCWPEEFGGWCAPRSFEFILWDTLAFFRACRPDLGPGLIAHVLITKGSDELRQRVLPSLASGSLSLCLGYSEPEAGSDLTNVQTRAKLDGDTYVVTGHKIWTSDAHHASQMWLLCRTAPFGPGSSCLSLFLVDMASPGITVSPIHTIDGHQVNEVFLDEVVVPSANRIGEEGKAWTMIREALAVERHTQVLPGRLRRDVEELEVLLADHGILDQPVARRALVDLHCQLATVEACSLAALAALEAGGQAVMEAAQAKFLGSQLSQAIPRVGLDLLGTAGLIGDNEMAFLWRESILETIAGGTVEVMASMLARQGLGLGSRR
jgi:alkylation response protein AidB-like acyl-CoA dehydrogenase